MVKITYGFSLSTFSWELVLESISWS